MGWQMVTCRTSGTPSHVHHLGWQLRCIESRLVYCSWVHVQIAAMCAVHAACMS